MRYHSIEELPFVWQINLPVAAQQVFLNAYNRSWSRQRDERQARMQAIAEVRQRFERDTLTGRWVAKHNAQRRPRAATPARAGGFSPRELTRRK